MSDPHHPSDPLHRASERPGDAALGRAVALVRFLRERCPWDARQDPRSLRPYLLEEAHEVAAAIEGGDDHALAAELGDLLLNVTFQIALAEERGAFDAEEVVERLERKMEARHPHVYGEAESPPDWEEMKARERHAAGRGTAAAAGERPSEEGRPADPFAGIPEGLEPLSRAMRAQERMAALGFDWPHVAGPIAKLREEIGELERALEGASPEEVEEEMGDLLFSIVNVARFARTHPSNALLRTVRKFEARCRRMLRLAEARGIDWGAASLAELDALWDETKALPDDPP